MDKLLLAHSLPNQPLPMQQHRQANGMKNIEMVDFEPLRETVFLDDHQGVGLLDHDIIFVFPKKAVNG